MLQRISSFYFFHIPQSAYSNLDSLGPRSTTSCHLKIPLCCCGRQNSKDVPQDFHPLVVVKSNSSQDATLGDFTDVIKVTNQLISKWGDYPGGPSIAIWALRNRRGRQRGWSERCGRKDKTEREVRVMWTVKRTWLTVRGFEDKGRQPWSKQWGWLLKAETDPRDLSHTTTWNCFLPTTSASSEAELSPGPPEKTTSGDVLIFGLVRL